MEVPEILVSPPEEPVEEGGEGGETDESDESEEEDRVFYTTRSGRQVRYPVRFRLSDFSAVKPIKEPVTEEDAFINLIIEQQKQPYYRAAFDEKAGDFDVDDEMSEDEDYPIELVSQADAEHLHITCSVRHGCQVGEKVILCLGDCQCASHNPPLYTVTATFADDAYSFDVLGTFNPDMLSDKAHLTHISQVQGADDAGEDVGDFVEKDDTEEGDGEFVLSSSSSEEDDEEEDDDDTEDDEDEEEEEDVVEEEENSPSSSSHEQQEDADDDAPIRSRHKRLRPLDVVGVESAAATDWHAVEEAQHVLGLLGDTTNVDAVLPLRDGVVSGAASDTPDALPQEADIPTYLS